ncbi:aminotransferase class I/II-fold pyridoxal phosphate-dependent enzyme [Desulfonatronospira sp.]|uniref:aminotransferase class I/II-fold pyridoxal phosphate-dependent enzyme n=1 Tax=Desulfonatronospira sp. TaxID=1962951 RepID=UPI0025BBD935|nr:aminotransferase class I/II-fold pyridoxal phosphate-dependent enzyme [Desulfonatronospira sp.]
MPGDDATGSFGLSDNEKSRLIHRMRRKSSREIHSSYREDFSSLEGDDIPDFSFKDLPGYQDLDIIWRAAGQAGIEYPFFLCHEGIARDTTRINGKTFLNFSTYDYLDLNGSQAVNQAAAQAMQKYGTSASASRLVAGERPVHRELETALANFYGVQDSIVFVSGHATNVWLLCQLFDHHDLVLHDSLIHNSVIMGARFSGAKRMSFAHNNLDHLEEILLHNRRGCKKAVIITEGLFSMDGDIPDLPRLLELKNRYKCLLMVDEAHSLGTLGPTGRGLAEHFGLASDNIDIIMGTLSKTLCACGGFIAGCKELVEYLKYSAPGFVFSVGISPPLAAASLAAINELLNKPYKVTRLQETGRFFLEYARYRGLDTGTSAGAAITPMIVGNSLLAGMISARLVQQCINVLPIVYPAVQENAARLRFFLSAAHNRDQVRQAVDAAAAELVRSREELEL